MRGWLIGVGLALAGVVAAGLAFAQQYSSQREGDGLAVQAVELFCATSPRLSLACGSAGNPLRTQNSPVYGVQAHSTVTVGTTSVQVRPAVAAPRYLVMQNTSAEAVLWCRFDGAAAVVGQGRRFAPGGVTVQDGAGGRFMSTGAINCISTAAGATMSVETAG